MELLIVTGMSGAGKTRTLQSLEDMGYYCVDNLPPQMILYLLDFEMNSGISREKMAVTVDIRCKELLANLDSLRQGLEQNGTHSRILYLDAADDTLKNRYKESRRLHPLIQRGDAIDLSEALSMERELLSNLRQSADIVLDTTHLSAGELRQKVFSILDAKGSIMTIEFVAFGYKYGILADADLVFDVRCLPNPYYEENLRTLTGDDGAVRSFVMATEESRTLFDKIRDLLEFSLPLYIREGKSRLVVGFGCTGGQHRSLVFAGMMKEHFAKNYKGVKLTRRDTRENRYEIFGRTVGTESRE